MHVPRPLPAGARHSAKSPARRPDPQDSSVTSGKFTSKQIARPMRPKLAHTPGHGAKLLFQIKFRPSARPCDSRTRLCRADQQARSPNLPAPMIIVIDGGHDVMSCIFVPERTSLWLRPVSVSPCWVAFWPVQVSAVILRSTPFAASLSMIFEITSRLTFKTQAQDTDRTAIVPAVEATQHSTATAIAS